MADSLEPRKEMVRITAPSQQSSPSPMPPRVAVGATMGPATSELVPKMWVNQVPMPLCWALVAISAAILILEIWNYLS